VHRALLGVHGRHFKVLVEEGYKQWYADQPVNTRGRAMLVEDMVAAMTTKCVLGYSLIFFHQSTMSFAFMIGR
jgi:hypothetical protein